MLAVLITVAKAIVDKESKLHAHDVTFKLFTPLNIQYCCSSIRHLLLGDSVVRAALMIIIRLNAAIQINAPRTTPRWTSARCTTARTIYKHAFQHHHKKCFFTFLTQPLAAMHNDVLCNVQTAKSFTCFKQQFNPSGQLQATKTRQLVSKIDS